MTPNSPTPETQKDPNLSVNSEHSRATTLTQDSITDFLNIQRTNYPHLIYDAQILQQNTTQSEMDEFLSTGSWRWSQETQDQYMDRLDKNTMIRTYPGDSLKTAQRVYPEKIIQQILYFNTPEGKFLLNDATVSKKEDKIQAYEQGLGIFGYTSGQINKGNHKIVGCRIDPQTQQAEPYLIEPDLSKGANAQYLPKQTRLSYSELPIRVNGFEYITNDDHHATPCNPCTMLNNPRDQSCRFRIRSQ